MSSKVNEIVNRLFQPNDTAQTARVRVGEPTHNETIKARSVSARSKDRRDIHNILYQQAKSKNNGCKKTQNKEVVPQKEVKSSKLNENSKKYYVAKFTKEIINIWTTLADTVIE